ncbi:MAG: hypothetical protein ACI9MR_001120 [Myxococcota bacterium]|jgi:hypothetical protein
MLAHTTKPTSATDNAEGQQAATSEAADPMTEALKGMSHDEGAALLSPNCADGAVAWYGQTAKWDGQWLPAVAAALNVSPTVDPTFVQTVAAFQANELGSKAYKANGKLDKSVDGKAGPKTQAKRIGTATAPCRISGA